MAGPIYLNALRAFAASARHGSFAGAAQELNVTPAAVGQLVRGLEAWLGAPVFDRSPSGRSRLQPTEAARRALPEIQTGFDRLMQGLAQLREASPAGPLTVTVSPAFAAKWLLPRLHGFQAAWPDTDVRLDTSLKPVDFLAQGIDIGVRYGSGRWAGLRADKLLDESVFPVCSPEFLARQGGWRAPPDLLRETLIHDLSMDGHPAFPTWPAWLARAGVEGPLKARHGLKINSSAAVLQAAIEGQGVALARSVMAHDDVVSGRLLRLFPKVRMRSPLSYYIVYREAPSVQPRVLAFRQWLLDQAR